MMRVFPALAGLIVGLCACPTQAQDTPARPLHETGLVAPAQAFANVPAAPQRSPAERAAAGGRWTYMPIFSLSMSMPDGVPVLLPRAILRTDLHAYNDLDETAVDVRELMRVGLQTMVTTRILPAADRVPEYAGYRARFDGIDIAINDVEDAEIQTRPWRPGTTPRPVITADYGLSHTLGHYATLTLQWQRLMAIDPPDPEAAWIAANRWANSFVLIWASDLYRQKSGAHIYDRGVIEALFPVEWTLQERALHWEALTNIHLVVLAHEVCHHILGHTMEEPGLRRRQELEADRCAARLYVEMQPAAGPDLRLSHYLTAAQYLATSSLLTWPIDQTGEGVYPPPIVRYRNIIDSVPAEVAVASPRLAEEIRTYPPPIPDGDMIALTRQLATAEVFRPGADDAESWRLDALFAAETMIEDYCARVDCFARLASTDPHDRYFHIRTLMDLAAIKLTIFETDGGTTDRVFEARAMLWATGGAITDQTPVARADLSRLMDYLDTFFEPVD